MSNKELKVHKECRDDFYHLVGCCNGREIGYWVHPNLVEQIN